MFEPLNPEWLEDEEEGGEGGEAGSGTSEPVIDPALFGLTNTALKKRLREFEARYGVVPYTQEPIEHSPGEGLGQGLSAHPLLSESAEFSGIDPKLNSLPSENPDGARHYDELQNRLAMEYKHSHKKSYTKTQVPTLKR